MKSDRVWRLLGAMALAASLAAPAAARTVGTPALLPARMPVGDRVEPPYGFVDFCARDPAPCMRRVSAAADIAYTPANRAAIARVNAEVNALPQVSDSDNYGVAEFWTYPDAKGGDCEDLALEKQRRLAALGFPESALLLAVARRQNGEGHTVLVVETDRGAFVLDNLDPAIRPWTEAPYAWRKRQSRLAPGLWERIDPGAARIAETPVRGGGHDVTSAARR